MSKESSIEVLMLLCCLVAVVSFFSFGLAATGILAQPIEARDLPAERQELQVTLASLLEKLKELELERETIQARYEELRWKQQTEAETATEDPAVLRGQLRTLKAQYDELCRRLEALRVEIAELPDAPDPDLLEARRQELDELRSRLIELEQAIEEAEARLAALQQDLADSPNQSTIEELETAIEQLTSDERSLQEEIEELKARVLWAGDKRYTNPLFLVCQAHGYQALPAGTELAASDLDDKEEMRRITTGHDIAVLFVMQEGFDMFHQAFDLLENSDIAFSYEPLEDASVLAGFAR